MHLLHSFALKGYRLNTYFNLLIQTYFLFGCCAKVSKMPILRIIYRIKKLAGFSNMPAEVIRDVHILTNALETIIQLKHSAKES